MGSRLGIDVGGTFTDLLLFDEQSGAMQLLKTPSTPEDQAVSIQTGIEKLVAKSSVAPADIHWLIHGTTKAANIVLQEKGARVGLLVTRNFEQVLHLARARTTLAGWIGMEKPDPLADLELTRGIAERIDARGEVLSPLDEPAARDAVGDLLAAGVEAICVSLLHAYANPAHEHRLRDIVRELEPAMAVSISSDISPEFGEYERTLVTVMNAYAGPGMRHYLDDFEARLESMQLRPRVGIARSDGGLMSVASASAAPVQTILSGPAGGVSAAASVASLTGHGDALGFDMGGTSSEVSLILEGKPVISRQAELGAYPIPIPAVDVHSVGAGGGSIAHVPMTGALRVGPQSAGAVPGPACYGHGGSEATVTDANVVLGHLPPHLLGGEMVLDIKAAEEAVAKIARTLALDLHRTAQGILDIANENIFGALRLVAVRRGLDPRDFALVAFGGAGPLHANALAGLVGCFPVIVPPAPGVLSALGFLYCGVRNEFGQTFVHPIDAIEPAQVAQVFDRLDDAARQWLGEEGIAAAEQVFSHEADVRYLHQGNEISLALDPGSLVSGGLADLAGRFAAAHEQRHGYSVEQPVEVVKLRVIAAGQVERPRVAKFEFEGADAKTAVVAENQVYFDGNILGTKVYDRDLLRAGNVIPGPAIVTQQDTTTVIHPGHEGRVDEYLNILITPVGG